MAKQFARREALGVAVGCAAADDVRAQEAAFAVEPGVRQLFLDDVGIKRLKGLRLTVN
jgi:hypothetical protein